MQSQVSYLYVSLCLFCVYARCHIVHVDALWLTTILSLWFLPNLSNPTGAAATKGGSCEALQGAWFHSGL